MYEEHKLSSTRFKAFSIPMLVILVLCIGLFSIAVSADWAECVQARLDGVNAVRLLVTADEKGTVTFTIDKNVITFAVLANVKLDTGRLRIDKAESVVAELSDAAGAVTARCTIPIEQLTPRDKPFCCDKTPPVIELTVTPNGDGKTVSWKIEDASSDVKECRVTFVANGKEHVLSPDCAGQRMLLASEFGAGTHEVRVRALDDAGNVATASQKVVLAEPTCSISGQVIDAATKQPIAGATVTCGTGRTQVTNAQGRFSFSDVTPTSHQYLGFFKDGAYEYRSLSVTCRAGEDRSIVISLPPIPIAAVELSWTEDPDESTNEKTVHVDGVVSLYVSVPEGATYYVGFDAAANSEEPRAVFSGTELDLSIWMKTLPSEVCGTKGCEVSAWDIVMDCEDYIVYFQVIGIMPDGSVVTSEVLTLHIDLT